MSWSTFSLKTLFDHCTAFRSNSSVGDGYSSALPQVILTFKLLLVIILWIKAYFSAINVVSVVRYLLAKLPSAAYSIFWFWSTLFLISQPNVVIGVSPVKSVPISESLISINRTKIHGGLWQLSGVLKWVGCFPGVRFAFWQVIWQVNLRWAVGWMPGCKANSKCLSGDATVRCHSAGLCVAMVLRNCSFTTPSILISKKIIQSEDSVRSRALRVSLDHLWLLVCSSSALM